MRNIVVKMKRVGLQGRKDRINCQWANSHNNERTSHFAAWEELSLQSEAVHTAQNRVNRLQFGERGAQPCNWAPPASLFDISYAYISLLPPIQSLFCEYLSLPTCTPAAYHLFAQTFRSSTQRYAPASNNRAFSSA
jgi:hypothetical protein